MTTTRRTSATKTFRSLASELSAGWASLLMEILENGRPNAGAGDVEKPPIQKAAAIGRMGLSCRAAIFARRPAPFAIIRISLKKSGSKALLRRSANFERSGGNDLDQMFGVHAPLRLRNSQTLRGGVEFRPFVAQLARSRGSACARTRDGRAPSSRMSSTGALQPAKDRIIPRGRAWRRGVRARPADGRHAWSQQPCILGEYAPRRFPPEARRRRDFANFAGPPAKGIRGSATWLIAI